MSMRQLKITKSITNRESQSLEKYLQEIGKVELITPEEDKFVRFRWDYMGKDEYFEWRIDKSEVTNQTILVISDFADKKEIKDQSQLWEYQVKELFHRLGS